jgi:hypothetical protein
MREVERTSETLVNSYHSTRRYNQEDSHDIFCKLLFFEEVFKKVRETSNVGRRWQQIIMKRPLIWFRLIRTNVGHSSQPFSNIAASVLLITAGVEM